MPLNVIEINDAGVRAYRDGDIVCESPGVAVIGERDFAVGAPAQESAHLHPRAVDNRFWQQLDETPLRQKNRRCRHHADLAYHHLNHVLEMAGRPADAVLAVPSDLEEKQLALLLGIASACDLQVTGLVDNAVAAIAGVAAEGRYAVANLYQHHAVLTEVVAADTTSRESFATLDQPGLNRIHEACVALIADAFLEQSRFDPLFEADTEQLLYTHLTGWLREARSVTELSLSIEYHGHRFSARIPGREFQRVTEMVISPIPDAVQPGTQLVLAPAVAALPGAMECVPGALTLPEDAVFRGVAEHRLALAPAGRGVTFATVLPRCAKPSLEIPIPVARDGSATAPVTHVLAGHYARHLSVSPLYLKPDGTVARLADGLSSCSISLENGTARLRVHGADTRVNGRRVSDVCTLHPGDHISLAGGRAVFVPITVED